MRKFALIDIDQVKGKIKFRKLVIDDRCLFDDFCDSFKSRRDLSKLRRIFMIMELVANIRRLGSSMFRELKRENNDNIKDYEIKVKPYRVYFFKDECNNIVVLGGTKGSQSRDIKKLRSIKKDFFTNKK